MTTKLSPDQVLDDLRAQWLDLDARRESILEQQDAIKDQIRNLLDVGKHHTPSGGLVTLSPNRRFNPELAAQVLSAINPDLVVACSVTKVDSSLTKRKVGEEIYEHCMKDSGVPRVSIQ